MSVLGLLGGNPAIGLLVALTSISGKNNKEDKSLKSTKHDNTKKSEPIKKKEKKASGGSEKSIPVKSKENSIVKDKKNSSNSKSKIYKPSIPNKKTINNSNLELDDNQLNFNKIIDSSPQYEFDEYDDDDDDDD